MDYLYHRVPKIMFGAVLYPLNMLKDINPEIYKEQVKKYDGREQLLAEEILPLQCLWNDVLHFTAVSPEDMKDNLAQAGIFYNPVPYFKIPVSMIEGDKSIAFVYHRDQDGNLNLKKKYEKFDSDRMEIYKVVPLETLEYYKNKKSEGVNPLLFYLIPHILYRGSIDTKGLEIVTV